MNLHYAQVVEMFSMDGVRMGKVRTGGAIRTISLALVPDAQRGDQVLLCDGMAISRVDSEKNGEDKKYVSGNSR